MDIETATLMLNGIGLVIVIIGLFYAVRQLGEMRKDRFLDAFLTLSFAISDPEERRHRAFIFSELPKDELTQDEKDHINRALHTFEILGALVKREPILHDVVLPMYAAMVVRVGQQVHSYIENEEKKRGYKHWQHFKYLESMCSRYVKEQGWELTVYPAKES